MRKQYIIRWWTRGAKHLAKERTFHSEKAAREFAASKQKQGFDGEIIFILNGKKLTPKSFEGKRSGPLW